MRFLFVVALLGLAGCKNTMANPEPEILVTVQANYLGDSDFEIIVKHTPGTKKPQVQAEINGEPMNLGGE